MKIRCTLPLVHFLTFLFVLLLAFRCFFCVGFLWVKFYVGTVDIFLFDCFLGFVCTFVCFFFICQYFFCSVLLIAILYLLLFCLYFFMDICVFCQLFSLKLYALVCILVCNCYKYFLDLNYYLCYFRIYHVAFYCSLSVLLEFISPKSVGKENICIKVASFDLIKTDMSTRLSIKIKKVCTKFETAGQQKLNCLQCPKSTQRVKVEVNGSNDCQRNLAFLVQSYRERKSIINHILYVGRKTFPCKRF